MAIIALKPGRNDFIISGGTTDYIQDGSDPTARHRYVEGIIVPANIRTALVRNQFNYMDILDYDKIRQILPVEDIALWLAANRVKEFSVFDDHGAFAYGDLFATSEQTQEKLAEEFNRVIYPLSIADTTKEKAKADLFLPSDVPAIDWTVPTDPELLQEGKVDPQYGLYEYKIISDSLFLLFVKPGILDAMKDRDYLKIMVSNYLKTLYNLLPLSNVSNRYRAFETYIELL